MAKQKVIQNIFENGDIDKYDRKYLQYVQGFQSNGLAESVFSALKTKDIDTIEQTMKSLNNTANLSNYLIGLGCVIIEREKLFRTAGYDTYIGYAQHLLKELDIPEQTLSDYKIIMSEYIDNYKKLTKAGFHLERNANKLRYLNDALSNHAENDVYTRIATDTFKVFRDWAQKKLTASKSPAPDTRVDAKIENGRLLINGQNILNFPDDMPEAIQKQVSDDLIKTFSIRESGNDPFIVETYGTGDQIAIANFLKKYRAAQ
jgi:hypothetical protein